MLRSVLIVDDEAGIRESLKGALEDEGYVTTVAASAEEGLTLLGQRTFSLVLLDIWLQGMDGLRALQKIKKDFPEQKVIMMSGHGTIETAVKATKLGAYDFIEKPLSLEKLLVMIENALKTQDLEIENQELRKRFKEQIRLIGESAAMGQIQEMIDQVAPTTGSVLITGENGTGKELVAHSIHRKSPRSHRPFVEVNCAAIPDDLIESELFGHEKGSFTGATQRRRGKFDLAHSGTLFLDEIGDMSLKTQAKVLRILQEQKFERVGGSQTIEVDVRIVAATNKDLKEAIKKGVFREDLYYRLNVIPFHIPPLRQRKQDIPLLVEHFLAEFSQVHRKKLRKVSKDGMQILIDYSWPGNVRELSNLVERMMILTSPSEDGFPITSGTLLEYLSNSSGFQESERLSVVDEFVKVQTDLRRARSEFERQFILKTLKEQEGNVTRTAQVLGIERSHLHKKMKNFGIEL